MNNVWYTYIVCMYISFILYICICVYINANINLIRLDHDFFAEEQEKFCNGYHI